MRLLYLKFILCAFYTMALMFLASPSNAQSLNDVDVTIDREVALSPLHDSGYPPGATLEDPLVTERFGTVTLTEDGRSIVLRPSEVLLSSSGSNSIPISVRVNSGTGETVQESFSVNFVQEASLSEEQLGTISSQLLLLLTISIFLEAALSVLFNWRVFQSRFEGRGVRTPVAVGVAVLIVFAFDVDVMREVFGAFDLYDAEDRVGFTTKILTAFIVAGGSSLVFRLFELFGLRAPGQRSAEMRELTERANVKVKIARGTVPLEAEVLVYVDSEVRGSIAGGSNISHNDLQRGFLIEPGVRTIKIAAVKPSGGEGGVSQVVEDEHIFTFAPRAKATLELAFV